MNIVLIVPGGVDRSGRERVVPALLWLIERLAHRRRLLVVTINQYPHPCRYHLLGAEVVNLGQIKSAIPEIFLPLRLAQLFKAIRLWGRRPDILHAFWAGETGVLAGLAGRLLRTPVVVSLWSGDLVWLPEINYGGQGHWRTRLPIALSLRLANRITGGSRFALTPLTGREAHWLPLGVDTTLFGVSSSRTPGPPWRLLHVAHRNRVKDQTTLLLALQQVIALQPDVQLDWVGGDRFAGNLPAQIDGYGLGHTIQFHGFQPLEAILPLYQQAHLFVQSSLHESQGVAVCEAAAAGVPTVGTAVGLVAELAPEAALAVPAGQPAALAEGILTLLDDSFQRERLGQAAQSWARTYDADWTAGQFEELYHQLHER
jgi:glycosyltransferase involved in cell wall biosynthesis